MPEGLRFVENSNWTGRAVVANRSQLDRALVREELSRRGIYVLNAESEAGAQRLYVGEADVLRERLRQHATGNEFWARLVAFTSTNEGLNKAHVRYLEARLVGRARAANQWELENGTQPASPPLSEADRADAEWFLAEMFVIFPVLALTPSRRPRVRRVYRTRAGMAIPPSCIFGSGAQPPPSVARGLAAPRSIRSTSYLRDLRQQLRLRGVLVADGEHLVFRQDFRFNSPSTAAGVLVGGSANGRLAWKDARGRTLKALQEERTEAR
jgi:hypothetical protein